LHLVGYVYYWQMGFNSVFKGLSSHLINKMSAIFITVKTTNKPRTAELYNKYLTAACVSLCAQDSTGEKGKLASCLVGKRTDVHMAPGSARVCHPQTTSTQLLTKQYTTQYLQHTTLVTVCIKCWSVFWMCSCGLKHQVTLQVDTLGCSSMALVTTCTTTQHQTKRTHTNFSTTTITASSVSLHLKNWLCFPLSNVWTVTFMC